LLDRHPVDFLAQESQRAYCEIWGEGQTRQGADQHKDRAIQISGGFCEGSEAYAQYQSSDSQNEHAHHSGDEIGAHSTPPSDGAIELTGIDVRLVHRRRRRAADEVAKRLNDDSE
jgi:hypothetical protein